ncbi:uncharacterized protein LOC116024398 [Ipomoea triloba]|uniref:uncharacterized protein LOC116024398 n=1 Tax=Ipomoea triloba TaxID=35885 RepID=UPI00125D976B|nr:uncharacterized protein LOC116024398 [Ipomoea triloba]
MFLSNKKKLEKNAIFDLSVGAMTRAILKKSLPPKLKDSCSFFIPCVIRGFAFGRAQTYINDPTNGRPLNQALVGVLEDILMMIDQYLILGDFVVLDIEEDSKVPIILGRPFLATAEVIDVNKGKLAMEIRDNKIEFNIFQMVKHRPSYIDEYKFIGVHVVVWVVTVRIRLLEKKETKILTKCMVWKKNSR